MSDPATAVTASPRLPRRERIAILAGLAGATLAAWAYLVHLAWTMGDMSVMSPACAMGMHPWGALDFALMFWMWTVMMVGMMVPSAAPMTLLYAAVARKASRQGTVLAPTSGFVAGYVAVWTLFSVAATIAQWALDQAALLSPGMATSSPLLGAGVLCAAGVYQLTPWKDACLDHCRAPALFMSRHWRSGRWGAFRMGAHHGAYCLGCCWVLMGLLFFGGVMSLLWIGGLTALVLVEKLLAWGPRAARVAGAALLVTGLSALGRAVAG